MRFPLTILAATFLVSSAVAAPTPSEDSRATSTSCKCLPDKYGADGDLVNFGTKWFQCAYPTGGCIWDQSGRLLTLWQDNCETTVPACKP